MFNLDYRLIGKLSLRSFTFCRLSSASGVKLPPAVFLSTKSCHTVSLHKPRVGCVSTAFENRRKGQLSCKVWTCNFSAMPAQSVKNGNGVEAFQRLPKNVVPANYDLTFEPDFTDHTYVATAGIDIEVKEQTDVIVLNASKFSVNEVTYTPAGCKDPQEAEVFMMDMEREILRINFPSPLAPGVGRLNISYFGKVADNLKGFFRSKYQGPNGEDRFHYLTKFEPTFARCCFPCWDEPSIKASYDITLVVPKHLVAVSNMPVKEDVPHPTNIDKRIVKFERSVRMSTYVMAFAIGEFDYVESRTPDGILCRVYTPVGKKERGNFALDVVMKSLAFYKNYFGIPYPLPKMDLLCIAEFGSGAMENWGLVIFREQFLLMDEKMSSSLTKNYVAIVVAHETAHMWFGNLVTMEWWNDLWLNEGFATWMEYECVNKIYPDFQIWNMFMSDFIHALELDASATSHPIQANVEDPADIGSIFDSISYQKGAAVIRMIHNFIGDENFKEGLKHYLSQHLFGNAETKHLWAALKEKSGQDIDVIMPTFTEQMGYPIITVKNVEQKANQKVITLSYQKFWAEPSAKSNDPKEYKWIIPLTVRKQSEPSGIALTTLINEKPETDFTIKVDSKEGEWVKLNADHVGYFRVTYPSQILQTFNLAVKSKELQPLDRLGILDDLFANAKAGHARSEDVLRFLLAYENEDMYAVWSGILNIISSMSKLLNGTPLHENFKTYARTLLSPVATKLGWDSKDNEKSQDTTLRTHILIRMVNLGNPDTIEEARNRFSRHVRGEISISPDVRSSVYRAVASADGESGFEELIKLYRKTDLLEEKVKILAALGATNDKTVIQKILDFGRGKEVTNQDMITILISLNDQGKQDVCWDYFKNNWEFFRDSFPTGHFLIRRAVEGVTAGFKTDEMAADIENFFKEHPFKGLERTVSQSLENIRVNKAWLERDCSGLQEFLSSYCA